MGRPKKPNALEEVLKIRVTPALLAQIDEARNDLSRSDWVRLVLQANTTRFEAGGDLGAVEQNSQTEAEWTERVVNEQRHPHALTSDHKHRRGEQRTKALGRVKATYFCAEPGCVEILSG